MEKTSTFNVVSLTHSVLLSIIVPVYNEQEGLHAFHQRLNTSLLKIKNAKFEILYVNDGSTDGSLPFLLDLMQKDIRIRILDFSRNFGKEAAMTAGLDQAEGDAVIIIDADLQDPPELIPEMVSGWKSGWDVVNMRRISRAGETWLKKTTSRIFYKLMSRMGPVCMPSEVGDFRLLSRRAVDALKQMPERSRIMKGLFAWIGFPVKEITYHRAPRQAGKTKWNYGRLLSLGIDGITSFSVAPLRAASFAGVLSSAAAFAYGMFVIAKTMVLGDPVPGYPSLVVIILFFSGIQLLAVGVVGEYLGRMFIETKQRPLYLIKRHYQRGTAYQAILHRQEKRF